MSDIRKVTDDFSVAPQLSLDEGRAAAADFKLVINNRPDGEAPGQPTSAQMEAVVRAAGADYLHLPVVGRPTFDQARAQAEAVNATAGPVLAFCRSGTRSITAWAMGQAAAGAVPRNELVKLGAQAGYDLDPILPA